MGVGYGIGKSNYSSLSLYYLSLLHSFTLSLFLSLYFIHSIILSLSLSLTHTLSLSPSLLIHSIFLQVCRGLQHLHSKNIVHRDLKSLNIFLCTQSIIKGGQRRCEKGQPRNEWVVKIGDLGVGRCKGENTVFLQSFYGTPLYASPELCDNQV